MGVPIKSDIREAKNVTYTNNKSIQDMIYCISEVIESKVLNKLCESDHFSLMFDKTTDCKITEQLTIHGRHIEKQTGVSETGVSHTAQPLLPDVWEDDANTH